MIAENNFKQRIQKKTNTLLNQSNTPIQEGHMIFAKAFIRNLVQEAEELDGVSPADFTPEKNKMDFEAGLSKDTNPEQFDIEGKSPEVTGDDLTKIKEFSDKLEQFADFLNDYKSGHSMHAILSNNDKQGSVLRGISRKVSDSITRISGETTKLREVLNSFIITAPKKLSDLAAVQQIQA